MTALSLKRFLVGAAFASMTLPSLAMAGELCAYVIGETQGHTVTTPVVPIKVPASEGLADPIRVHLDETAQNIIGYSVPLSGVDGGTEGTPLFSIPAIDQTLPSFSVNIPALNLTRYRCVDATGATVPAFPYSIPASAFTVPGGFLDVGAIFFNITGQTLTVPGHLLTFDGKQVIIPEQKGNTPATPITTPNQSVTLNINQTSYQLRYLASH